MIWPAITDQDVLSARPARNPLDPQRPYAFLVEPERSDLGVVEDVLTVFLTNRECPFHCTMCDLWKNTLDERGPAGAIVEQVRYALERLPGARHIKLYNAGNFFDVQAIPEEEHPGIASLLHAMSTVIVENHPRMTDERCLRFRDLLTGQLEIALGLETIHPEALRGLNKRMTVEDFDRAMRFLSRHGIQSRTFLLLNPPGLTGEEAVDWTLRSLAHAVEMGVGCVSVIPTRANNGVMESLRSTGHFVPPTIRAMEVTLERSLAQVAKSGRSVRVFMDLWVVATFFDCHTCGPRRADRIQRMNLNQRIEPVIECPDCGAGPHSRG